MLVLLWRMWVILDGDYSPRSNWKLKSFTLIHCFGTLPGHGVASGFTCLTPASTSNWIWLENRRRSTSSHHSNGSSSSAIHYAFDQMRLPKGHMPGQLFLQVREFRLLRDVYAWHSWVGVWWRQLGTSHGHQGWWSWRWSFNLTRNHTMTLIWLNMHERGGDINVQVAHIL